ncbi:unnamed protein product [Linum trigynum]|uniref:Reverse transcriptase domain-containing protein n=1 Tax=Linum trigynum TaxID=586398 RepID=A0AAV2FSD9_9ROSI
MERLGHLISTMVNRGEWTPIKLPHNGRLLSHSFFADDLILFEVALMEQVQVISGCLEEFGVASGQQVSRPKSRIFFSKNVSTSDSANMSNTLGIPATSNLVCSWGCQ